MAVVAEPRQELNLFFPLLLFGLAIVYVLSPIDPIPDIPVLGQIDDLIVATIATLNLLQKWLRNTSAFLSAILGMAKWLLILGSMAALSLAGMAVMGAVQLFAG